MQQSTIYKIFRNFCIQFFNFLSEYIIQIWHKNSYGKISQEKK